MPWSVRKSDECPASKPWAVVNQRSGDVEGCHATEDDAHKQMAALYAKEDSMSEHRADTGNITTPDSGDLNTAARKYAASRGWAMADGSYPIRPLDMHGRADLQKAVRAVGRGSASHEAIRRHIMKRARALGLSDMIPDNWSGGGGRSTQEIGSTMETHYRSFSPDLQVRSGEGGRTVYGIAVPYNAPTRIDEDLIEQFARSAFNHQFDRPQRVKFARNHQALGGELIGAASLLRDDPVGLYVELRTAKTPMGEATLELVREGALDQLSIAFREGKNRRLGGGVVERVVADLREVAVVTEGAYGELAVAAGVRSRQQQVGSTYSDAEMDLRMKAQEVLAASAGRELPDYETQIRAIRLGLPI